MLGGYLDVIVFADPSVAAQSSPDVDPIQVPGLTSSTEKLSVARPTKKQI